jgi:hypothetical protein
MAYKISTKTKITDKGDAWGRGRIEQPVFAVAGANDTGTWEDSPNNSYKVNDELEDLQKHLKSKGIHSKIENQSSSNVFMQRRWLIVETGKYEEAKKLTDEYMKEKKTNYLYEADNLNPDKNKESIYELKPSDSHKSYYGKAIVTEEDGKKILTSYSTDVAEIENGKAKVNGLYSATTTRHIKDFLRENGFKVESSKQIMKDYGEKKGK